MRYDVRYCAPSPGLIRSDHGLEVEVPDGLDALQDADIIIARARNDPHQAVSPELVHARRRADAGGKPIVGLWLASIVHGEAGRRAGKGADTSWLARAWINRRSPTPKVPH